jgi:ABC-2 type transport system permease protein
MTIPQTLRVIRRLFAVNIANTLAYRAEFFIYMFGSIITPIMALMIWRATLASGAELPVDTRYLTTYFVLSSLAALVTSSWHSGWIPVTIRDGKLSIWLVRPGSVFLETIANNLAEKAIKFLFLGPMVAVFWWFYRDDVTVTGDLLRWTGCIVCLLFGAVYWFAFQALIGSVAFWMQDSRAVDWFFGMVQAILLGGIVPLVLFPGWARGFVDTQPFRFRFAFALDVLLRDMSGRELLTGLLLQAGYAIGFVALARWCWLRGLRSYAAVGG